jgi:hypothetical protein
MQLRSRGTNELLDLADGMTVGRMADCAIRLQDGSISRHHASIESVGGVLFLVDNGSSNGCFRNGDRVQRCELRVGDLITLGALAFDVVGAQAAVESAPSPVMDAPAPSQSGASSSAPNSAPRSAPEPAPAPTASPSSTSADRSAPPAPASSAPSASSRAAAAAAERARIRHEISGDRRSKGLGDLSQQSFGVKVLAGLLGLGVMYGVIVGIRILAASL